MVFPLFSNKQAANIIIFILLFFVKNDFFFQQNMNTVNSPGVAAFVPHALPLATKPLPRYSSRGGGVRSSRLTPGYQALAPNGAAQGSIFNITTPPFGHPF